MSTGDDFLRAIAEKPEDDALRLVYADWLEESGDADRAAFVRAQLQAAREPRNRYESPARARVERLWRANGRAWVNELPAWARTLPRWERGTLHSLQPSARAFLKHGPGLLRRFPTVRALGFTNDAGLWPDLVASPAFAHVRELEVGSWTASEDVATLLAAQEAARIESLRVKGGFERDGWRALGQPGVLPALERLNLGWNHVPPASAAALAAGGLERLSTLSFNDGTIGTEALQPLLAMPAWGRLRHLDLGGNPLGDAGVRALLERPPSSVETLSLADTGMTDEGVEALAAVPFPSLVELMVSKSALGRGGLRPILSSPHLPALERLYLQGMEGGPPDPSVFRLSRAARLTDLGMANVQLTDASVKSLAASPRLTRLVYLDASYNPWGDKGAAALAASPHLTSLATLVVKGTGVTARGVAALRERWGDGVVADSGE